MLGHALITALALIAAVSSPVEAKGAPPASGKGAQAGGAPVSLRAGTEKTVPLRTHSLYAPYVDSDLQNRWFDFGGSTIINTNKHVRLTQDRASQAGWLWSRLALAPNTFEIEFEFRVDGKSSTLYGDGFAMWLTKSRAGMGPVFGSTDYWDGLGIFFDTYANSRHSYSFPRIYAIMNDGKKSYDVGKDGQGQEIGSCSLDFRRTDVTAKARLTYFKGKFTELAIHHDKWDEWTTCFTFEGLELPSNPFLGFSAHTGDVHDNHDIISITTSNVAYHAPAAGSTKPPPRQIPGIAFFSFLASLLKWVVLIVLVVVGVMAYRAWKVKKDQKRF
ncbi:legume-like lectin family-domain-containing protein [Leucosporidium creatinivorum]|uniref:Legume-like lectin family-domain-containing protein n=1 Tax=Leucosporidium creatinivorum TaxID=106004 RepID=A0A1Y2FN00_9BASI|nr:legume-like lectin family-domain-containing protein [Leucosporidium creatinivorum]